MRGFFLYIALVGLPLLVMLGVLRVGENLRPPPAVGGTWLVKVDSSLVGLSACDGLRAPESGWALTVSQSGPHLVLSLAGATGAALTGEIEGSRIQAALSPPMAGTDELTQSAEVRLAALQATLDRESASPSLSGTMVILPCTTSIPFTARRQPPASASSRSD